MTRVDRDAAATYGTRYSAGGLCDRSGIRSVLRFRTTGVIRASYGVGQAHLFFVQRRFWGESAVRWVPTTDGTLAKVIDARTIVELFMAPRHATRDHFITPAPVVTPMVIYIMLAKVFECSIEWDMGTPTISTVAPSDNIAFMVLIPVIFAVFRPPSVMPDRVTMGRRGTARSNESSVLFVPVPDPSRYPTVVTTTVVPVAFYRSFEPYPVLGGTRSADYDFLGRASTM